jgi:recombination protein RecT
MAKPNDVKTAVVKQGSTAGLIDLIKQSQSELARALPKHMSAERIGRIALTCIRTNPDLLKCTPESFLGALFTSAQIGIEPIAGRGYLIPFNNSRKVGKEWKSFKEVQFVLGYKGVIDLFYRHSKAINIEWGIVRERDEFDYEMGTESFLRHRPAKSERGEVVGYWALAQLTGGGKPFLYMDKQEAIDHGLKHSKTVNKDGEFFEKSPWVTDTDSMCLKTVLVQLAKLLPLSVDLQRAIGTDETSRVYRKGLAAIGEDMLDVPDTTEWTDAEPVPDKQPETSDDEPDSKPEPEQENGDRVAKAMEHIAGVKTIDGIIKVVNKIKSELDTGDMTQSDFDAIRAGCFDWMIGHIKTFKQLAGLQFLYESVDGMPFDPDAIEKIKKAIDSRLDELDKPKTKSKK